MKRAFLIASLAALLTGALSAAAISAPPPLVVILLPGTSLQGWQSADAPHLHSLMHSGALAVMNTRTAHLPGSQAPETPESALLTLGAGARAAAGPALRGENIRRAWPAALEDNRRIGYDLCLGSLSDTLAAHGVAVLAGGGPDADWVAAGNNSAATRASVLTAAPGVCLIWDAGSSISAADAVIESAAASVSAAHGRLIVLSPYARAADYAGEKRLTPVLVWGPDVPAGLLYSPTTRRSGLIANTDFAPSVAAFFGVPRDAFSALPFGADWSVVSTAGNELAVGTLDAQSVQQAEGMKMLPYLALALGFWILAFTVWVCRGQRAWFERLVPMVSVTAALFSVSTASFFLTLSLGLVLAWLGGKRLGARRVVSLLAGMIVLSVTLDMVSGSFLMRRSLLGYSAIEGARYYGVGNEAMGLLVGAVLSLAAHAWPLREKARWGVLGLMLGISLLFGTAGAKAGGLLVSLAAFGTFTFTAYGRQWNARAIFGLSLAVAVVMALAAVGDAYFLPKAHSHIGEAVRRIGAGGSGEAGDIIRRKLNVEGRLAYHSAWAVLLWLGAVCTYSLWRRRPAQSPAERAVRNGGIVGFCTCLAFNDAGVVAAALLTVMLWSEAVTQKQSPPAAN